MKRLLFATFLGAALISAAQGQMETGVGARAFGLANNHTALSSGSSDLFWNPGAMGFSVSREFQASLYGIRLSSSSDFFKTVTEDDLQRFRIGNAGFLFAIPASRGGMSIAASYSNPVILDDVYRFSGSYSIDDTTYFSRRSFRTTGNLNYWTGGLGLQIAKNLGAGIAASLVTGRGSSIATLANQTETIDDYTTDGRYVGYDLRAGLMYKFSKVSIGARFTVPQVIRYSEFASGTYDGEYIDETTDYNMYSSYKGALGVSALLPFFTVTAEVRTTLPYDYLFPVENIPDNSQAGYFKTGAGIGIEVPLVVAPFIVRAGYSYDDFDLNPFVYDFVTIPDNERDFDWSDNGVKVNRNLNRITAGIGYTTASTSFDLSYGFSTWGLTTNHNLVQTYKLHRLLASFAIRF
jgi:hypothetical protein